MKTKLYTAAALMSAALLLGLTGTSQADTKIDAKAGSKLAAASSISGKVVDADGKAVAGAMVRVIHKDEARPGKKEKHLDDGQKPKKRDMKAVASGKTDEAGAFKLEVPAGEYVVVANSKGVGAGRSDVTVADGASATVEITLKERPNKPAK